MYGQIYFWWSTSKYLWIHLVWEPGGWEDKARDPEMFFLFGQDTYHDWFLVCTRMLRLPNQGSRRAKCSLATNRPKSRGYMAEDRMSLPPVLNNMHIFTTSFPSQIRKDQNYATPFWKTEISPWHRLFLRRFWDWSFDHLLLLSFRTLLNLTSDHRIDLVIKVWHPWPRDNTRKACWAGYPGSQLLASEL